MSTDIKSSHIPGAAPANLAVKIRFAIYLVSRYNIAREIFCYRSLREANVPTQTIETPAHAWLSLAHEDQGRTQGPFRPPRARAQAPGRHPHALGLEAEIGCNVRSVCAAARNFSACGTREKHGHTHWLFSEPAQTGRMKIGLALSSVKRWARPWSATARSA